MTIDNAKAAVKHARALWPKWAPTPEEASLWVDRLKGYPAEVSRGAVEDHRASTPYATPKLSAVLSAAKVRVERDRAFAPLARIGEAVQPEAQRQREIDEAKRDLRVEYEHIVGLCRGAANEDRMIGCAADRALHVLRRHMDLEAGLDAVLSVLPAWGGWRWWSMQKHMAATALDGLSTKQMAEMMRRAMAQTAAAMRAPDGPKPKPIGERLMEIREALEREALEREALERKASGTGHWASGGGESAEVEGEAAESDPLAAGDSPLAVSAGGDR